MTPDVWRNIEYLKETQSLIAVYYCPQGSVLILGYELRQCLILRNERIGKEWNRGEMRREEWKGIVKLNFIVWFDIKFDRERNCNFFLQINLSFALNTKSSIFKLAILVTKYNLILIPNFLILKSSKTIHDLLELYIYIHSAVFCWWQGNNPHEFQWNFGNS